MAGDQAGGQAGGIRIIIIGAGLAGLAAAVATKVANPAHLVTVCETVPYLHEVGVSAIAPIAECRLQRRDVARVNANFSGRPACK
jgi:2-polyprenyl-6-methoxyphenol hydroxylase-like FAD-dependent oxidoreductase